MLRYFLRLRRDQGGFTLIELMVVVAIIALLATFAVPRLFEAINKAKAAPGQADVQTISSALERRYLDKNQYPVGWLDNNVKNGQLDTAEKVDLTGATGSPDGTWNYLDRAEQVMRDLKGEYVKATTTFRNGFKQGYLYATSTNGLGYMLIDMQGLTVDDWGDDVTNDTPTFSVMAKCEVADLTKPILLKKAGGSGTQAVTSVVPVWGVVTDDKSSNNAKLTMPHRMKAYNGAIDPTDDTVNEVTALVDPNELVNIPDDLINLCALTNAKATDVHVVTQK